jgi:hypothetical protein
MAADNSDLPEMAAKERGKKRVTHLQQATAGRTAAASWWGCWMSLFCQPPCALPRQQKEGFIFACWVGEEEELHHLFSDD